MRTRLSPLAVAVAVATSLGAAHAAQKPVKIYILAGQSNMNTFGHSVDLLKKSYPDLQIPTKNIWYVEGSCRGGLPKAGGWGVETPFGIDMATELGEPVLLFKSNKGGTTLTRDWLPPSAVKRTGGEVGYLYNRMIRRFHNMIQHVEEICPPVKERGYEVAAFVWFQGESDARNSDPKVWEDYEQKLRELITDVRRDVGVRDLPFLNIQINNIPLWDGKPDRPKGGARIREAQKKVAEEDPKGVWISTSNLSKGYHYDAKAHLTIGRRMAKAMLPLAREVVPTEAARVEAAGKAFRERTYPDLGPDVSPLKKGLIFHLPFDKDGSPSLSDRISGRAGKVNGEVKHCAGLFGQGAYIDRSTNRHDPNRIEFPDFKDPVTNGVITSISISFWVKAPNGHVGDAVTKYARGKGHNSMKNGWRMVISAYGNTGLNAIHDGVAEWKPNPKAKKGRPYVHAAKAGTSTIYGDNVEWHHVVAVYDNAAKTMRAYVDAGTNPGGRRDQWARNIPGRGIVPSEEPLTIHSFSRSTGQLSAVDEIAIWDRPLTEDEVKALYNNGNGVELD